MLCETLNTNDKQKELPAANSIQLCQRFLMAFLFFYHLVNNHLILSLESVTNQTNNGNAARQLFPNESV